MGQLMGEFLVFPVFPIRHKADFERFGSGKRKKRKIRQQNEDY